MIDVYYQVLCLLFHLRIELPLTTDLVTPIRDIITNTGLDAEEAGKEGHISG